MIIVMGIVITALTLVIAHYCDKKAQANRAHRLQQGLNNIVAASYIRAGRVDLVPALYEEPLRPLTEEEKHAAVWGC